MKKIINMRGGGKLTPQIFSRFSVLAVVGVLIAGCGSGGGGDGGSSGGGSSAVVVEFNGKTYQEVTSSRTTKIWLDRNQGADQVCVSKTDTNCYGDLYQWGRQINGHEIRTSTTTTTQMIAIDDTNDSFVYSNSDWASVDTDGSARQALMTSNDNDKYCPPNYRVPTKAELQAELDISTPFDDTNFDGFLKIPQAGYRYSGDGVLTNVGLEADFWVNDTNDTTNGWSALITSGSLQSPQIANRAYGFSVRCIKN